MELSALVLLDDNPDAVKMAATWLRVRGNDEVISEDDLTPEHIERWCQLSGLDWETITSTAALLFGNEILGPGKTINEDAKRYLNTKVAARLRRASRETP